MLFRIDVHKVTLKFSLLYILLILFFCACVSAQGENPLTTDTLVVKHDAKEKNVTGKFDPGKMIMEHVVDNHEWHIAEIGDFHLTIPLPVLLFYDGKFYAFWSGKFHNETNSYKGFTLAEERQDHNSAV
jgi:hypothetical protein